MAAELSDREVLALRLHAQGLAGERDADAPDVLQRLLALQGQDLPGALWSIGLRSGAVQEEVAHGFTSGELIRSWPFRGTLFVLAAKDLHWILALTGTRTIDASARRRIELGLDDSALNTARATAEQALAGGGTLGRADLLHAFEQAGLSTAQGRGYHLLFWLSLSGVLVQGPLHDKEQHFVLAEEWIGQRRDLSGDEALAELVRRHIRGRGPVSEADIAWWSKLPLGQIRRGADAAGDSLVRVPHRGRKLLVSADALPAPALPAAVLALPGFDEYVLGYQDRGLQLEKAHAPRIVPGGNGVFKPTVVSRGRIVGVWAKRTSSRAAAFTAEPLKGDALPATVRRGFERAAARHAAFLGLAVR